MKDTLMHHHQLRPTVRMHSFNNVVQKGQWNLSIIHKSVLKHVAISQRSLELSFSKKRKKWEVFQQSAQGLLSEGKSIVESFVLVWGI
jgi:hypothetical protein